MLTTRASGILLHPTCFPTRFGIGDLGPEAHRFLDWLAGAGQQYWQVLPLGPTDHGDSPYQSPSAFGGNPLLISPDRLLEDGLLVPSELKAAEVLDGETAPRVNFDVVGPKKRALLEIAHGRFRANGSNPTLQAAYDDFRTAERSWLDSFARFMALREANESRAWLDWTRFVDERGVPDPSVDVELADRIDAHAFWQFLFFRQWDHLRQYGRERGVSIIGDAPIYVSLDSADVWAHRKLFQLDDQGRPTEVAGVPPDYFSADGQLWNNPLYDWAAVEADGYRWWIDRIKAVLRQVDLLRLDHFRGFEAYWSVAAGEPTAVNGQWKPGPADRFLGAVRDGLGQGSSLPIIAEDLGMITEQVHALRHRFELPGMKVMQFRLPGDPWEPPFRLDEFEPNSVVYTGTHDNDTTKGWFTSEIRPRADRLEQLQRYTPCDPERIAWEFLEIAWKSSSLLAIAPLQDVLSLGSDARMNAPGTVGERNWRWKYAPGMLTESVMNDLRGLTAATGRLRT